MNGLIQELTNELMNNSSINSNIAVKVVLESINNSLLLGVAPDLILENSLTTLDQFAIELVNENIKEVVAKFRKMANNSTKRLQDMAKEAGLSLKLQAIKESEIYADPVIKHTVAILAETLTHTPEYRALNVFYNSFSKFSYDKTISSILEELVAYVNGNIIKLEILNAVFEMRTTGAILYKDACALLEESLLANLQTSDSLKMKLRTHSQIPAISQLLNKLSLLEANNSGSFNLGRGNGESIVKPVICPFYKVNENSAIIFVDNKFVKVIENEDPEQITLEEANQYTDFYKICEAFSYLQFKENNNEITANCRALEITFGINENGTLNLQLNKNIIDDLSSIKLSEIFLMETIQTRSALTTIFENLDFIVNLEFGKVLINERLEKNSIVLNFGENIYVFEKAGQNRIVKKMKGLTFHNYVMENFKYDVSDMYSIQLEEHAELIKSIDSEKLLIDQNLAKLELSITKIEEALTDNSLSSEYREKLDELRISLEKNVNSLKSKYILLDQSKKKV